MLLHGYRNLLKNDVALFLNAMLGLGGTNESSCSYKVSTLFILGSASGCGTYVPHIEEVWDSKSPTAITVTAGGELEYKIKNKVYCELKKALQAVSKGGEFYTPIMVRGETIPLLPENWGAQVSLDLQVDETGALNPGATFITPMHAGITNFVGEQLVSSTSPLATVSYPFVSTPQMYTLGIGGTLSSQATREDKFGSYWDVDKLKRPVTNDECKSKPTQEPGSSLILESDLGIKKWLADALVAEQFIASTPLTASADPGFKTRYFIVSYKIYRYFKWKYHSDMEARSYRNKQWDLTACQRQPDAHA
jgi:hypothetical protein